MAITFTSSRLNAARVTSLDRKNIQHFRNFKMFSNLPTDTSKSVNTDIYHDLNFKNIVKEKYKMQKVKQEKISTHVRPQVNNLL